MSGLLNWYHITLSTHNSWLPGDPRGWRSWHHRIHSSGHHRSLPPAGEHQNILDHSKQLADNVVFLPSHLHAVIGRTLVGYLQEHELDLLSLAVAKTHIHLQVQLPTDQIKKLMGHCKRHLSFKFRHEIKGQVWSRGVGIVHIKNKQHQQAVFQYILKHQEHGAYVWSYRDQVNEDL